MTVSASSRVSRLVRRPLRRIRQGYRNWRLQRRLRRLRRGGRQVVHYLHIGKTGGTALKHMLSNATPTAHYRIVLHPHRVRLSDVPAGDKVVFFLRDPVARFESGFWSRQRQGRPRYDRPWNAAEARAFAAFKTPNELALALGDADPQRHAEALQAMRDIRHVADSFSDWLVSPDYLRSRAADILFIGWTESLDADSRRLAGVLGLPATAELPTDPRTAHRRPADQSAPLEPRAVETMRDWFSADYELIEACRELFP